MQRKPPWRWYAMLGRAGLAVYAFGCLAIAVDGLPDKPIDYRHVVVTAWWTLVFCSIGIVLAVVFFLALARGLRPVSARVTAIVVVGGLVAVAGVVAWRGVVTPWTPVAAEIGTDTACEAADRAGVGILWPRAVHRRAGDETADTDLMQYMTCTWTIDAGSETPPYSTVSTSMWLFHDDRFRSGVRTAAERYVALDVGPQDRRDVSGLGDEATATSHWNGVTVTARRANVVFKVAVYTDRSSGPERIAKDVTRHLIAMVKISEPDNRSRR